MKRRQHPEDCVQRAVCQHLQLRGVRGLLFWHAPNGGKRRPIEAAIMKSLGVRAGVADLILLHSGRIFALELKAEDGRPTAAQMQFISDFNAAVCAEWRCVHCAWPRSSIAHPRDVGTSARSRWAAGASMNPVHTM